MQAHWSREDLPHWDKIRDADDMAGNGLRSRVIDIALDEVVDHLNANHPKSDDVRRVEAQRDTQKTKARRARRARDKWQARCATATENAQMWMDEAIAQRQRADDLERSLADIRSTLEASNDAMVEAITEERDALDDRLAKVDVELSETLVRAERAESLAEAAKATANTHLETLVSTVAKRDAAVKRAEAAEAKVREMEQDRDVWRERAVNGEPRPADEPDPVEDKARELYEAARPATTVTWGDFVAEAKEPYRNMARHVLGADDE